MDAEPPIDDETPRGPRVADDQAGTILILYFGVAYLYFTVLLLYTTQILINLQQTRNQFIVPHDLAFILIGLLVPMLERSRWRVDGFLTIGLTLIAIAFAVFIIIEVSHSAIQSVISFGYGLCLGAYIKRFILDFIHTRSVKQFHTSRLPTIIRIYEYVIFALIFTNFFATAVLFQLALNGGIDVTLAYYSILYAYCGMLFGLLIYSWLRLRRHVYEIWVESWARIMYKIRIKGPGVNELPRRGPVLIIANHACWWDPLFVAGNIRRPIIPMMTAGFYDIWHLRPFMKHFIHAIRVPEKAVRHEAPEIREAVAALDRGECVVIFPEGYLRRKEEVPLRRFGRGVYEILKARPQTPMVAAWIEGAWGSWCSWKGGPPTKNKRIDFRRRIDVGFGSPFTVPAEVLAHHWPTRVYLMNAVSRARTHLGLDPLPEFTVTAKDDE